MTQHSLTVFLLVALSLGAQAQKKPLSNNDVIEMSRGGVPEGTIVAAIQAGAVNFDVSPQGLVALHAGGVGETVLNQMIRANTCAKSGPGFGVATGTFPVKEALGKTVRYSAWIKTENVANGYAGIWWRVDGSEKNQMLAFDNSQARFIDNAAAAGNGVIRGATGTTDWTRYEFELPVAEGARNINFGLIFNGTGTAWFDALKVEVGGAAYVNLAAFDLDFESSTAKGFYTGGNGYQVGLDKTVFKTGAQSLKMQFVGDGGPGK